MAAERLTNTISVSLPQHMRAALETETNRRRQSVSDITRTALARELGCEPPLPPELSAAKLARPAARVKFTIDAETKHRLFHQAKIEGRWPAKLVNDAIELYLEQNSA